MAEMSRPSSLFISYARRDEPAVTHLHSDLRHADYEAWFDRELGGAQRWWDEILERIRSCDVFVFALSPYSVKSKACRAELNYARALERPIMPVLVGEVNIDLAPDPIGELQVLDYRERTPENVINLLVTIAGMRPAKALPQPLPNEPPPPITDLGPVRDRLAVETLTFRDQQELILELQRHIDDVDQHPTLAALLEEFRSRSDIVKSVSHDVEILIDQLHFRSGTPGASSRDLIRALLAHLRGGRVTPITGTGLTDSLVGTRRQIAHDFAQSFDFPMSRYQREDLPQVAQFVTVMTNDETLRSELSDHLRAQLQRHFSEEFNGSLDDLFIATWNQLRSRVEVDSHSVLARLPCPIFITGHHVSLLGAALRDAGKDPVEEVCRWRADVYDWPQSIFDADPEYVPTADRPLVFHVFGHLGVPDSLVITEDDYIEFMIGVAENKSAIPAPVRVALADSALLLLGFGLQDQDVRVLLRSLVGQQGARRLHRYTHVAAQVDLSTDLISPLRARNYLERYFGKYRQPSIDIYWGTVDEFTSDLAKELVPAR
jgi:TIR domain/SIR2-like domain